MSEEKEGTMMKARLIVLFAAFLSIALVVLLMVGLMQSKVVKAAGPTFVSGGIFADTTWSTSQSPYIVTGTVTLFPGYTLTIEPGVEVRFNPGTSLTIRGTLVAEGTISNRIVFTSTDSVPTKGSWIGLMIANNQGGNASVKFANISYAKTGLSVECCWSGGPLDISNSVFSKNVVALGGYAGWEMQVESCTFENNTYAVTRADKRISGSVFRNNDYGLYETERISVYASIFISNQVALWGGRGEVKSSRVTSNGIGVQAFYEGFSLYNNTIVSNTVGVILGQYDSYSPPVEYNNIFSNTVYNMKNTGPSNKDAINNWWGTTNTSAIDASIYDGRDDVSLGLVIYQPFLQGERNPPNDAPVADHQFVSTDEDVTLPITLTASNVNLDPLTYLVETIPSHGSLGGTAPNLTYIPAANYNGTDSFTFVARDDRDTLSNLATVSISIDPVNDAPVADDQVVFSEEDVILSITLSASDVDLDPLSYLVDTIPSHGSLGGTAPNLTYTPIANYNGTDSFTFRASDNSNVFSNVATVSISIDPVNDAPVADHQFVSTSEDVTLPITLTASDVDLDPLTYLVDTIPSHGSLSGKAPNLTYTPIANYYGTDSFTFRAIDNSNVFSNVATVDITIFEDLSMIYLPIITRSIGS